MSSRPYRSLKIGGLILLLLSGLPGCQNGTTVTPQEEARFKHPPKEMPPEAARYMRDHGAPPANAKAPALGTSQ